MLYTQSSRRHAMVERMNFTLEERGIVQELVEMIREGDSIIYIDDSMKRGERSEGLFYWM